MNGQGIPCGRNSSYSFIPILLKLHWCFGHGLKICIWFGYNHQIIFCYFFCKLNLAIFRALLITMWMDRRYLVGATPTVLYQFFWNFTGVLFRVWRYACGLDNFIILRLFLSLFFCKLNLVIFQAFYITKWMDRGYLVGATPNTLFYRFMFWRYACGLDINLRLFFVTFFSSWT